MAAPLRLGFRFYSNFLYMFVYYCYYNWARKLKFWAELHITCGMIKHTNNYFETTFLSKTNRFGTTQSKTAYQPHPGRHHLEPNPILKKQICNSNLHLKVSHCAKFQPITPIKVCSDIIGSGNKNACNFWQEFN